jgi:hypothetical protein
VGPIRACNGDRLLRTDYVSHRTFASRTTAGLRQPLLVRDVRSQHKAPFAMHKRTFTRAADVSPPWFGEPTAVPRKSNIVRRLANAQPGAAGVSPPWVGEPNIVQRESNIVRRLANAQPGAAGVSPPWFRFALATVIVFCGVITFRTAHSLTAPRLAYASRS